MEKKENEYVDFVVTARKYKTMLTKRTVKCGISLLLVM